MYPICIEQPYPTSHSVLDYLLYQEQLKKEQEAMYYYRLRQQRQQQERALRLQQEQERKRRLLAYYQQEYNKKRRLMERQPSFYYYPEEEDSLSAFLDYISRKPQSTNVHKNRSINSQQESESEDGSEEDSEVSDIEEEMADVSDNSSDDDEDPSDDGETESERESSFGDEASSPAVEPESEDKRIKMQLLKDIEKELKTIRKEKEQSVLGTQLDFSHNIDDTIVEATTFENKQFLGYEDQIMKMLLRLDTIESEGDQEIRKARKNLVKFAEDMLETIDEFKHKEWERASSSHSSDSSEELL